MESIVYKVIEDSANSDKIFCKFLSANDTGETGGHQSGIYIPKNSFSLIFDTLGVKGENKESSNKIKWQDDFETEAHFKYYGQGTRNEYRITGFGKNFPFLKPSFTGSLIILLKQKDTSYKGYVLETEDEIEYFLNYFGITPTETNRLINTEIDNSEEKEKLAIQDFIRKLKTDFPSSVEMSLTAQRIQNLVFDHEEDIQLRPDDKLLDWTEVEYRLFRAIEHSRYSVLINNDFSDVDKFIELANQVLNRRKSRAGKSLEHHLSSLFLGNSITFTSQAITEGNKKPDFIFPSIESYHNASFPVDKLASLAAKTTCKDRWRQILNEADRLRSKNKFLCTLQQGISAAQLEEMKREKVVLVVPEKYIKTYPEKYQHEIWTVKKFIEYIKEIEG
ncbi:MAG: type II restriction endonuclease [Treponemataceae bacterium]|nr:type II restriction endonuclease [Treponemataceae bacterium]